MGGFFRNLAQAAKEGYNHAKQELAAQQALQNGSHQHQSQYQQQQSQQTNQNGHHQYQQHQQYVNQSPPPQQPPYQPANVQPQQQYQAQAPQYQPQPAPIQQQYQSQSPQSQQQYQPANAHTPSQPQSPQSHQQQHYYQATPTAAQQGNAQSQQAQPAYSPAPTTQPTPVTQPQSQPLTVGNASNPSPGCPGYGNIKVGQYYTTVVAPNLAFCPSCYQVFVASTPYASRFNAVADTSGQATCDMAFKSIRDAWKNTCAKANSTPAASDREIWLQHFATQYTEVITQVTQLAAQISALAQEVQVGQLQADFATKSSMIQISHGHSMQAINNSQILGSYTWSNSGSITADAGNARFGQAMQMQQGVHMKQYQLNVAQSQLRTIIGSDENGRPTWT